jgi:hypothetical protein
MVIMLVYSTCARRPGGGRFYLRGICVNDRAMRARHAVVDSSQHTQACFFVANNKEYKLDCTPSVRQESYLRHRETRGDDVVGRRAVTSTDGMTAAYDLLLAACALRRGLKIVTHNARSSFASAGSGSRTGIAGKLTNPVACRGTPDERLAGNASERNVLR